MLQADPAVVAHYRGAFDRVLQLPDVPGPEVALEHGRQAASSVRRSSFHPLDEAFGEIPRKREDVFGTFSKRRDVDFDDPQTVKKILAKPPFTHLRFKLSVCRRDDPDVDVADLVFADAADLFLLDHP